MSFPSVGADIVAVFRLRREQMLDSLGLQIYHAATTRAFGF